MDDPTPSGPRATSGAMQFLLGREELPLDPPRPSGTERLQADDSAE
jgi:hypothetical protein